MRRSVIVTIAAAIVAAGTAAVPPSSVALAAGGAQTWSQPQAGTNPPDDDVTVPVYDDATGQLLLTPGQTGTWAWDGGNWTQLHPTNSPPPRLYQAVAYDGAAKQVVLFGGDLYQSTLVGASHYATDTWTWNGVNWTLQHPATAPPSADKQICAAYDPATRQVLMYEIAVLTGHSATWSWTGTNWVQLTVNAGPPMGSCSMAYDTDQHTMLMLVNDGGLTTPGMQVWRWDGAGWALTPMTMPIPTTYDMSIAYDADAGEMVAVVSAPTGPPPYIWPTSEWQTWVLAGGSWSQAAVTTPSDLAPLAFDAGTHQLVSIEASADNPLPPIRTWVYGSATVSNVSPTRVSGTDREATAVAVSQSAFPSGGTAPAVVLARADAFPDALSGGPLAGAKHGPLLLTSSGSLDVVTKAEIQRVLKPGGTVYLLGGAAALSASVSSAVSALGFSAVRLAGADRFSTAIAIAGALGNPGTVFEASGEGFADALSAVPAAVAQHGAIMLTDGPSQPAATSAYLRAHPGAHYAIGGAAAAADPSAIALAGADRYSTSAQVARAFFPAATGVSTASGASFPDALAGGPVAGAASQPLLLVPPTGVLPEPTSAYLQTRNGRMTGATVFGGLSAVGADVLTEIVASLDGNAVAT